MDPNLLKKLNLPASELTKIIKRLQKEETTAHLASISAPDFVRFFIIENREALEAYRRNPRDPSLPSFVPFCSDFMMDDDDDGEQFKVQGYHELSIHILINPATMHLCIRHNFKLAGKPSISVADIFGKILDDFPEVNKPGIYNLDEFAISLAQKSLRTAVEAAQGANCEGVVQFETTDEGLVCIFEGKSAPFSDKETLERAIVGYEFLLRFFIDSGTKINYPDTNWTFFMAFDGSRIAGFLSAYHFHLSSFEFKVRISQLVVPPLFRKKGLGLALVFAVYQRCLADDRCRKVTVEDPNDSFTHIQFKVFVKMVQPNLKRLNGVAGLLVQRTIPRKDLQEPKKALSGFLKCSAENAEMVLNMHLLSQAKREAKLADFEEYLANVVRERREAEQVTQARKLKRKLIVFEDKRVSSAKISKLYAEMQEEDPSQPPEAVAADLLAFLQKQPAFSASH